MQYYEALKQLIEESGRYDQKDDFTVVLQPFMRDWRPPMNVSSSTVVELTVHNHQSIQNLKHVCSQGLLVVVLLS